MSEKKSLSFDVLIEIPKGSRNKYEYDFTLRKVRYDRMIFSSMMYPADYGFVPETLALDSDPLDVLVLVTEPTFPGCVMEVSDPIWNKMNDLTDLNPHLIKEIEHFFSVYKDLEKKKVAINGWGDVTEAVKIYHECKERYVGSNRNFSIN